MRLTRQGCDLLEREAHSMARVSGRVFDKAVPDVVGYLDRLAAADPVREYAAVTLYVVVAEVPATA